MGYLQGLNNRNVDNYKYGIDKRTDVEVLLSKINLIDVTNYNDGNKGEMYTFNHEETEQTPALTDYRYTGNVPNNYVSFNDGETWRIIGVFDTDNGTGNYEKRIKLIRDESLGVMKWSESDENEWVGSTIQGYLNDNYDFDDISKEMVATVTYYLGGRINNSVSGNIFYLSERSQSIFSPDRNIKWIGLIGLIYPSDYIYTYSYGIDDTCYNTPISCGNSNPSSGWLFHGQMTLMPNSSYSSKIFHIISTGRVGCLSNTSDKTNVYPTLYLKPEVKIYR